MQHSERLEKQVGTWITLRRQRPRHHANVLLTFFWMRPASRSLVTPVASVQRPESRGPRPKPQRAILQACSKVHEDVGRRSIRGRTIIIDAASITFDFALCVWLWPRIDHAFFLRFPRGWLSSPDLLTPSSTWLRLCGKSEVEEVEVAEAATVDAPINRNS